jgi:D-alanine-D-alanine ligase
MNKKICLGILFGGRSGEHEVSLMSARSVLAVLSPEKYEITPIAITTNGEWVSGDNLLEVMASHKTENLTRVTLIPEPGSNTLYARRRTRRGDALEPLAQLDVIFPVLHGTFGEDGTLQGFLELADLPYVGAGVLGSAAGMDKGLFKDVMKARGVPVLPSIVVTRQEIETGMDAVLKAAEALAPYPLFTKPANLGSSVGVCKCRNRSDLMEGLLDAGRYDRRILIERGLSSPREIEVSVLGNDQPTASVPGEVIPSDDFYSYRAKYIDDRSQLIIPAKLPEAMIARIRQIAVEVYQAIDCAGMARVDFLIDTQNNEIFISEINTIPGFTQISMYPKLWEASGISYPALVERLIELALERKAERDRTVRTYGREG